MIDSQADENQAARLLRSAKSNRAARPVPLAGEPVETGVESFEQPDDHGSAGVPAGQHSIAGRNQVGQARLFVAPACEVYVSRSWPPAPLPADDRAGSSPSGPDWVTSSGQTRRRRCCRNCIRVVRRRG